MLPAAERKGYRRCTKCGRSRAERFFKPRGEVCFPCQKKNTRRLGRETRLKETYLISLEEYDLILAAQGGGCAICHRRPKYNLDIDHDHLFEKLYLEEGFSPELAKRMSVRGLLCKLCNRHLLPSVGDRPDRLQNAIRYLAAPPAQTILRKS